MTGGTAVVGPARQVSTVASLGCRGLFAFPASDKVDVDPLLEVAFFAAKTGVAGGFVVDMP
jgi:hypothetical protein